MQLRADCAFVPDIESQNIQQLHPGWIDVLAIKFHMFGVQNVQLRIRINQMLRHFSRGSPLKVERLDSLNLSIVLIP